MYSLVEATFGAGYTLGPGFGSWLYSYGGFLVPFCFSGGALLVTGKPSSIILSSTISIPPGVTGLSVQISVWGGLVPPQRGETDGGGTKVRWGGLARDSRQSKELKKLGFQMLKKRLFVKQNHFIG